MGLIIGAAVAVTIINLVLQLILAISNLILGLAGVILNWVLSPYFMSLPYTYGGVVDIGWPIVRDFVNMLFIVALVIIGLSTALRIKEYQAQKALPLLIIIAILINFTPVICGLIMDAQNIFMNFFLEELTGFKVLGNLFSAQGTMLGGALAHFYNPLESLSLMGKTIIMIIFDWVAAFIFFMYALLFVMRYIMVWVLVIVSPIAFFSRVFPGSQKYFFKSILGWDEWWKQFIEWSMIGIIGAFFLYLGEQLMVLAPGWIPGIPPGGVWGVITTPLVDFINQLLPWGVALAFLIIGFFMATTTSAMGAGAITKWAQKTGVGIAKAAKSGMITRPLKKEVWPRAEKAFGLKEKAGWAAGKLRTVPGIRHLGPVAAMEKYGEWRGDLEKAKDEAKGFSSYNIGERIRTGEVIGKEATGELLQAVERGDSEDYFKGMAREYGIDTRDKRVEKYGEEYVKEMEEKGMTVDDLLLAGETDESKKFLKHASGLISTAYRGGLGNNIVRVDPRLAAAVAGEKGVGFNYTEEDETIKRSLPEGMAEQLAEKRARKEKFTLEEETALRKAAISRAEEEARPKHIANTEREVFENETVVDTMAKTAGTDKYRSAITNVKRFAPTFMDTFDKLFKDFVEKAGGNIEDVSEEIAKAFMKEYDNYFTAIKHDYLKTAGLSAPRLFPEEWLPGGVASRPPAGVTPGISPGLGAVPPEFEEGERKKWEEEERLKAEEAAPKVRGLERLEEKEEIVKAPPPRRGVREKAVRGVKKVTGIPAERRKRKEEEEAERKEAAPKERGVEELEAKKKIKPSRWRRMPWFQPKTPSLYYEAQLQATRGYEGLTNRVKGDNEELTRLKSIPLKAAEDIFRVKRLESRIKDTGQEITELKALASSITEKGFQQVMAGRKKPKTLDEGRLAIRGVKMITDLELKEASKAEEKLRTDLEEMEKEGKTAEKAYEIAKKQYDLTKENREKVAEQLKATVERLEKFVSESEKEKKAP